MHIKNKSNTFVKELIMEALGCLALIVMLVGIFSGNNIKRW